MADITLYLENYWGRLPAEYIAWDNRYSKELILDLSKNDDSYSFDGSIRINDSIDFKGGDDKIIVSGGNGDAFYIEESTQLSMGKGNDTLGSTQINPELNGSTQHGYYINGILDLGSGDDIVKGSSILINGINSSLNMGDGDDIVSAYFYGGTGVYDFGNGSDTLYMKTGNYKIESLASGVFSVKSLTDTSINGFVKNLEYFSSPAGNKFKFEVGTINIQEAGSQYIRSETITSSTWSDTVRINLEKTGLSSDSVIQAKQVDKSEYESGFVGSIVTGTSSDDIVRGLAGFDQLFGKAGDDLIHGGNGRDIIDGGSGSDELHGDFGWNTFLDQQDGSKDLIAIKSDQHLSNFWYGKAGNSPNGEKADFIEGLDATDEIKIIGVFTPDISVVDNVTARGVTGIGIYAKGTLEAVYTGGNLSTSQIQNMTTGDGSTTAMNNQMWSYWGDNTVPPLQT